MNNNVVLVGNSINDDFILIGTGIGFNKKNGDEVDLSKVEKKFNFEHSHTEKLSSLLNEIPVEYIKLVSDVVENFEKKTSSILSNSIYIGLSDHIYHMVKLWKEGIVNSNYLIWEIKKFYPDEYEAGVEAVTKINQAFDVNIPESEAGNIALHIINAQFKTQEKFVETSTENVAKKIKDILSLITYSTKVPIDETSLSYERFITHLRYFFKNFEKRVNNKPNPILLSFESNYPLAYETMLKVENYLEVDLSEDERLYLCIHIQKLIE